jgi:hypothetical protein
VQRFVVINENVLIVAAEKPNKKADSREPIAGAKVRRPALKGNRQRVRLDNNSRVVRVAPVDSQSVYINRVPDSESTDNTAAKRVRILFDSQEQVRQSNSSISLRQKILLAEEESMLRQQQELEQRESLQHNLDLHKQQVEEQLRANQMQQERQQQAVEADRLQQQQKRQQDETAARHRVQFNKLVSVKTLLSNQLDDLETHERLLR